jgi:hypothetical protein
MLVGVILVHVMSIIIKTMAESQALIGRMHFPAGASRFKVLVGPFSWPGRQSRGQSSWTLRGVVGWRPMTS